MYPETDLEVRHYNMEESVLFIKGSNVFTKKLHRKFYRTTCSANFDSTKRFAKIAELEYTFVKFSDSKIAKSNTVNE